MRYCIMHGFYQLQNTNELSLSLDQEVGGMCACTEGWKTLMEDTRGWGEENSEINSQGTWAAELGYVFSYLVHSSGPLISSPMNTS